MRPQKHVSRAPPCRRNMVARALCITISDDRGDESFADDLNMGRGIVSGRVALLLRSTEIPPHRPNDLLPSHSHIPGSLASLFHAPKPSNTCSSPNILPLVHFAFRDNHCRESGLGLALERGLGLRPELPRTERSGLRTGQPRSHDMTRECETVGLERGQGLRPELPRTEQSGLRTGQPRSHDMTRECETVALERGLGLRTEQTDQSGLRTGQARSQDMTREFEESRREWSPAASPGATGNSDVGIPSPDDVTKVPMTSPGLGIPISEYPRSPGARSPELRYRRSPGAR